MAENSEHSPVIAVQYDAQVISSPSLSLKRPSRRWQKRWRMRCGSATIRRPAG